MANKPEHLVDLLNHTSRLPCASVEQFILDYSKRSVMMRDVDICATDPAAFVADLLRVGDIELIG